MVKDGRKEPHDDGLMVVPRAVPGLHHCNTEDGGGDDDDDNDDSDGDGW